MNAWKRCSRSVPRHTLRPLAGAVAGLFLGLLPGDTRAQAPGLEMNEVMNDLMLQTPDANALTTAWWLPAEIWQADMLEVSEADAEEFRSVLRPYTVVGVVDGVIGPLGGATFVPRDQVLLSVRLIDAEGRSFEPLAEEEAGSDARMFLSLIGPLLARMMGPMGENMVFMLFPAESPDGERIADPLSPGRFSVRVGSRTFEWETPVGSMLPPKYCPVDGRKLNGAWTYCPWHGVELRSEAGSG